MESIQCSGLRSSNNFRLPNTFFQSTPTSSSQSVSSISDTYECSNDSTNFRVEKAECSSTRSRNSKFRMPNVSCKEVRSHQSTHFQFKEFKRIRTSVPVQIDKYVPRTGLFTNKRLGCQNRFDAGLLSHPSGSVTPAISESPVQDRLEGTGTAPDHLPALRAVISTQGFFHSVQLGRSTTTREGPQSNSLSGRLPNRESGQRDSDRPSYRSCSGLNNAGLYNKFPEISAHANQSNRLPGYNMESRIEFQIPSRREATETIGQTEPDNEPQSVEPKRRTECLRNAQFCFICCTKRSTSLPPHTNGVFPTLKRSASCKVFTRSNSTHGAQLVAQSSVIEHAHTRSPCHSLPDDGCLRQRVGRRAERQSHERHMATETTVMAQQCQGNVGHIPNALRSQPHTSRLDRAGTVRQQKCCELYKKPGRLTLEDPLPSNQYALQVIGREPHRASTTVHSGATQCRSRPSVQTKGSRRVVSDTRCMSRNNQSIRSARNRLIRLKECTRDYTLRIARLQRLERGISRRLQQAVEIPQGLGIPAPTPCATSPSTSQQCRGDLHPNSTSVAQSILEARPQTEGSERTLHCDKPSLSTDRHSNSATSTPSGSDMSRSLVGQGWNQHLIGWSNNEINLLNASWRPSTKRVYACIWTKWQGWCKNNNVNYTAPSGSQLAKYLAYLHLQEKLAYKTILVYKSTIATLSDPGFDSLSNNVLVKRILKAIAAANADRSARNKNPSVWDPRTVVEWMTQNSVNNKSLYNVSQRTALILLLASSRRVHDLTLLHIDPEHFEDNGDNLVMHPIFGSKTDNYVHRQTSWKLLKAPEDDVCPVYWVRALLEASRRRRSECGTTALFISCTGVARPASRTQLGGWVRALLRSAGVEASAGSTRRAAASLNWLDNCSIDTVMAKGNWRTPNTFARYYSAEIRNDPNNRFNLARSFQSV